MKLLFAHDHKFRMIQGKIYSTGGLSDDALIRYTKTFGKVTVLSRIINEENTQKKYSEITNKDVTVKDGFALSRKQLIEEVKKVDCIVSRMPSFLGLKVIKIAKKLNKPYLVEVVGCPWDSLWNHSLKGKIIAPYMTIATKLIVKKSPDVLYVTNEFLQNRYPTNGNKVNCSNVALNEFDDLVLERRINKINNSGNKIIIGTTAAIDVKYKGQYYIIKALSELKKQGIVNYEYQLVGGGDPSYLKAAIQKLDVEEQVKILGPMPHNEVFKWLETIDLYVQPSRQEGLPRALIEAMSRGVPAFGARTGGIPELLDEDFIFSNTNSNIDEICRILKSFNKDNMKEQAYRNYNEAKKYDKNIIEECRSKFFKDFYEKVEDSKEI